MGAPPLGERRWVPRAPGEEGELLSGSPVQSRCRQGTLGGSGSADLGPLRQVQQGGDPCLGTPARPITSCPQV